MRTKPLLLTGCALALILAVMLVWGLGKPAQVVRPGSPDREAGPAPAPAPTKPAVAAEQQTPSAPDRPEAAEGAPAMTPEKGLQAMRRAVEEGDPRYPPLTRDLIPNQLKRKKPSAEALANPDAYLDYEQQQSRRLVSILATQLAQIPHWEKKIAEAEASGDRSPEEIREAREAIQATYEMRDRLAVKAPELLEQIEQTEGSPPPVD